LKLYNSYSFGCVAAEASVHKVTEPWAGATATEWSGPAYEDAPLQTINFAYGTDCASGNWASWELRWTG
jgi:hypothetical protein